MQDRDLYYLFVADPVLRSTILVDTANLFMSDSVVQKFINEDRSSFDLVIVESFFQECTVALGHKYGAPLISIVPVAPWVSVSRWSANPSDFSYIKDFMLDGGKLLNFWERFFNTYIGLYGLFVEPITYLPKLEDIMNTYMRYPGHETRPTMAEMLQNISLNLIDSDLMILSPRPYMPNFIEVPGFNIQQDGKINQV
jgi:glucuronosyltransferase